MPKPAKITAARSRSAKPSTARERPPGVAASTQAAAAPFETIAPPTRPSFRAGSKGIVSPRGRSLPARPAEPAAAPQTGMALHTVDGARKYLTTGERAAFLRAAELADRQVRTLCMALTYAGCRLSEALALTADRVDLSAGVLTIESLKKRRSGVFRTVPVPPALLETLDMVHGVRELQSGRSRGRGVRLWPWSRMTGWRAVHAVMQDAGLDGPHASPKGLRHGFGVAAVSAGIPLNLVQKWLGHAQLDHDGDLRQCSRRRGEEYRSAHVDMNAAVTVSPRATLRTHKDSYASA